jgi:hypothetical protein
MIQANQYNASKTISNLHSPVSLLALCALAENQRAYSHHSRPLFDCDFKIVAHAHRQMRKAAITRARGVQVFEYLSHPPKVWPYLFDRFEEWRNRHQPPEIEIDGPVERFDYSGKLSLIGARFGRLASEVYLRENNGLASLFARYTVEPRRKFSRIDGMNNVEYFHGLSNFVRLKMAYQVPAKLIAHYDSNLQGRLLDAILPKLFRARINRLLYCHRVKGFGDGDEGYLFRFSARAAGCLLYSLKRPRQPLSYIIGHRD